MPGEKPAEASLDWKPIAHTALGPGIEPGTHWCKGREEPLRYLPPLAYNRMLIHIQNSAKADTNIIIKCPGVARMQGKKAILYELNN